MTPFTWDEVYSDPLLPQESKDMYQFANDMGWHDGFCIPMHGPGGYQGLVSLLAREKLNLTPRERGMLEMISRAIHDRCRSTLGFGLPPADPPKLTPRA
jgi:LuxR family quorum sensing-dependent transcriptional regulator